MEDKIERLKGQLLEARKEIEMLKASSVRANNAHWQRTQQLVHMAELAREALDVWIRANHE